MAIYHLSMQIISRSKGQNAVASSSYRSGERLEDERTGEVKFYKRDVQPENMILAPSNSPEWVQDRQKLWNEVEKAEIRKDAQLAREMNIALPKELSNEQQRELIRSFAQEQFVNKGMIADIAIHRDDKENPHAHIMLTMRTIDENGFGKKNRDWNADFANSKENQRGFVKSNEKCLDIREEWANYANKALEREGIQERISHLSHEARGLETLPSIHLGHVANEMEKRGIASDRGDINREVKEYNKNVVDLAKYREEKQLISAQNRSNTQGKKSSTITFTDEEKVNIKRAKNILKDKNVNIPTRLEQLNRWEKKLNNDYRKDVLGQDHLFKNAKDRLSEIDRLKYVLDSEKFNLENTKFSIFKFKEKKEFKEKTINNMIDLKATIKQHESILKDLGIKDKSDFDSKYQLYTEERPRLVAKDAQLRAKLKEERNILEKAMTTYEKSMIRDVASRYPNNPEMGHITYETAQKINSLNKHFTVDSLKDFQERGTEKLTQLEKQNEGLPPSDQQIKLNENMDLVNDILNGIEVAAKEMAREGQKEEKSKGRSKSKSRGMEMDM